MTELSTIELDEILDDIEPPPLLPKGWYEGSIRSVEERTSAKENEYYNIAVMISPSQFPPDGEYGEFFPDGVQLYYNRILVPKAGDRRSMYRIGGFMKKLGVRTNVSVVDPSEWVGCNVKVRVDHGSWEGEDRMEIGALEASEEAQSAPAPKKRKR